MPSSSLFISSSALVSSRLLSAPFLCFTLKGCWPSWFSRSCSIFYDGWVLLEALRAIGHSTKRFSINFLFFSLFRTKIMLLIALSPDFHRLYLRTLITLHLFIPFTRCLPLRYIENTFTLYSFSFFLVSFTLRAHNITQQICLFHFLLYLQVGISLHLLIACIKCSSFELIGNIILPHSFSFYSYCIYLQITVTLHLLITYIRYFQF